MSIKTDTAPVAPPFGQLESTLIDEFLRGQGVDAATLAALPEEEREKILVAASVYASGKLMEVEARSHFLDEIHGSAPES